MDPFKHKEKWKVSKNYKLFSFFSYRKKDYIVTRSHRSERRHEPSNSYGISNGYYKVYRGERKLGVYYEEMEVFTCRDIHFFVTEDHTAGNDNEPFIQGKNLPFERLRENGY